jgi:hypothetical protein
MLQSFFDAAWGQLGCRVPPLEKLGRLRSMLLDAFGDFPYLPIFIIFKSYLKHLKAS